MSKKKSKGGKGKINEHPKANTNGFAQNPQNAGRPKKLLTLAKEQGYRPSEVREVMSYCLTMTREERIDHLNDNPDSLEAICIRAIDRSISKGNYSMAKDIIEMVAGKPKQAIDMKQSGNILVEGEGKVNVILPPINENP